MAAPRLRLYDVRLSDFPEVIGLCKADVNGVASAVNSVQRRLLYCKEAGDEGWWGTYAEVAFNVNRTSPFITTPRDIARLEQITLCRRPVAIHNQFYEYLQFGNGRLPRLCNNEQACLPRGDMYERNNAITFVDLNPVPQYLRIISSSTDDSESRVLIQGTDNNGQTIYSSDGSNRILGQFVTLEQPFVQFPFQLNRITGIQKDVTVGTVQFFQVDPTTGAQVLLLTMEPGEQVAGYRRYYLNNLPVSCCPVDVITGNETVQVTAIAKLAFIPVTVDTDYCLLQNLEAMIEEAKAMRYSRVDSMQSKQMSLQAHAEAVRYLNGELVHFVGKDNAAINFMPFGSARLERQGIGLVT